MLPETTRQRLNTQLDSLDLLLLGVTPAALAAHPQADTWSAHENIAHVTRHHHIFLGRLRRILAEDRPHLGRYSAEDDPEWPSWAGASTEELLARLRSLRTEIVKLVDQLEDEELKRIGVHPVFGDMNVLQWLEFFLLHESHHYYLVMLRLGQAALALKAGDAK